MYLILLDLLYLLKQRIIGAGGGYKLGESVASQSSGELLVFIAISVVFGVFLSHKYIAITRIFIH